MKAKGWSAGMVGLGLLGLLGCGTLEEVYYPHTLGTLNDGQPHEGLALELSSPNFVAQLGPPVSFSVVVKNAGAKAVWFPKKPQQGFFWSYASGRRDCFMIDRNETAFFHRNDCVWLEPGRELVLGGLVDTQYFPRPGLTEFRAEVHVPRNTNPELQPFWSGRLFSNGYGVMMVPFRKIPGAP